MESQVLQPQAIRAGPGAEMERPSQRLNGSGLEEAWRDTRQGGSGTLGSRPGRDWGRSRGRQTFGRGLGPRMERGGRGKGGAGPEGVGG